MEERKSLILLLIWDAILVFCSAFSTTATLTGFHFMVDVPRMAEAPYLVTFTGLSNLFVGIAALLCFATRIVWKDPRLPVWAFLVKLGSVSMILITFLVTSAYLTPATGESWWKLYVNAGFFNHALTPVLAIVGFLAFERKVKVHRLHVLFTLIPMAAYEILYSVRVFSHYDPNVETPLYYDIYGFARFGIWAYFGFLLLFLVLGAAFSFLFRLQNGRKKEKGRAE